MELSRRRLMGIAGLAPLAVLGAPRAAAAQPRASAAQSRTIRVATPFAAGHILAETAVKFQELLQARTGGRVSVEVATSVLDEQQINPAMSSCDPAERVAEIMLTGGQPVQDYAPAYFFVNGPYVIRDYAHLQRVWASDLGGAAKDLMRQQGNLVSLGTVYRGLRQFTSNRPIAGPANLAGLKLRLPPVPDWIAVWSSLGTVPVQVPLTGIYEALRTGVAEASEGDLTQISSLLLYEVQSELTLTDHLVGFGLVAANGCFLDGLPPRLRAEVCHAMAEATQWGTETMAARESGLLAELAAAGMTVATPDAAAIREAARPAIDQLFATSWNVTTWNEVLAI